MLIPVGLGGLGLVAQLLGGREGNRHLVGDPGEAFWTRGAVRNLALFFAGVHLFLAPVMLPAKVLTLGLVGDGFDNGARSINRAGPLKGRTLVFVNGPDFFFTAWTPLIRRQLGLDVPKQLRILSTTYSSVTVTRVDARTLHLSAPGGLFTSPFGSLLQSPRRPPRAGQSYHATEIEIRVERTNAAGRPVELTCRFPRDLDRSDPGPGDPGPPYTLTAWHRGGYRPFVPPSLGKSVELERVTLGSMISLSLEPADAF
jgi:hypothetical protein